jgi:dTDP-4-amino-4,6-dideoxygalactose transaminase
LGYRSSYYKYPLILGVGIDKAEFARRLMQDYHIETGNIFYPPCHLQDVYQKLGFLTYGSLSVSEQVLAKTIALPMHVELADEDVAYVADKTAFLAKQANNA